MRTSVNKDDPGYANFEYRKWQVFLDGKDVTHDCITADEEEGFVLVHVRDENGKFQITVARDSTVQARLTGKVEIREKQRPWTGKPPPSFYSALENFQRLQAYELNKCGPFTTDTVKEQINEMTKEQRQEIYEHLYNLGCRKF